MTIFDASALLAFLSGETGDDVMEKALLAGDLCSAGNWSEVAQRVRAAEGECTLAGLPLADRLCQALAARTDSLVPTTCNTRGQEDPR